MFAGYGDIGDADLAFMSSSDFYALFGSVLDHHYAFLLLACALEDEVVACWLVHADHLLDILCAFGSTDLHVAGKLASADLALELSEVVVQSAADYLFLYLDADPFSEALEVN